MNELDHHDHKRQLVYSDLTFVHCINMHDANTGSPLEAGRTLGRLSLTASHAPAARITSLFVFEAGHSINLNPWQPQRVFQLSRQIMALIAESKVGPNFALSPSRKMQRASKLE